MYHRQKDIPIVKNLYELYKIFYNYSSLFPKKDRYLLGSKTEKYLIEVLELLIEASNTYDQEKKLLIKKANVKFDTLKIFIRLLKDLKIIDDKKYLELQKRIQEIGKMLGGWYKSIK